MRNKFLTRKYLRAMELKGKASKILKNDKGEPTTVSILVWCVVAVLLILLILGIVYSFIKGEFMPALCKKVMDIFTFSGYITA